MAASSTAFKRKMLGLVFGLETTTSSSNQSYYIAPYPVLYVGLSTTDPATAITEPTDANYARVAIYNAKNTASYNRFKYKNNSDAIVTNEQTMDFGEATAAWGNITHYAIFDSAAGTTPLIHGALTTPKAVASGDVVALRREGLEVSISDSDA